MPSAAPHAFMLAMASYAETGKSNVLDIGQELLRAKGGGVHKWARRRFPDTKYDRLR